MRAKQNIAFKKTKKQSFWYTVHHVLSSLTIAPRKILCMDARRTAECIYKCNVHSKFIFSQTVYYSDINGKLKLCNFKWYGWSVPWKFTSNLTKINTCRFPCTWVNQASIRGFTDIVGGLQPQLLCRDIQLIFFSTFTPTDEHRSAGRL